MDNLSKVIFTCLAISITLLVYQNTQLKNDLDTLQGFVELDTKAQWERIEALENPYKDATLSGVEFNDEKYIPIYIFKHVNL